MTNPVTAALRAKRADWCFPRNSANARQSWAEPFLTPASDASAVAMVAGWAPLLPGQAVPLIGEEVGYAEPCCDE